MNFIGLIFLLITQYITGRGLLTLLRVQVNKVTEFCFSNLCGVALFAFPPFILELLHIPITLLSVVVSLLMVTGIFFIPLIPRAKTLFTLPKFRFNPPALYEYPFYIIFLLLMFLSIWRCFYLPPNARDMTSGPELMAQLAISEKHIINSIFSLDLQSTNNYLKPPYITSLQIIYKLLVQPLGQTWLSITFVSFIIWLFSLLREKLHPLVVCFAMLIFFAMPELFGYTYLMLFDYSNMVFFVGGVFFLNRYFEDKRISDFSLSVFLFTIATYIRTETPILLVLFIPIILFHMFRDKLPIIKIGIRTSLFMVFPAIIYFLCMNVYVKHYIPVHYDVSADVNKNLGDIKPLFDRISDITTRLMFGKPDMDYLRDHFYGFFLTTTFIILGITTLFYNKLGKIPAIYFYGYLVVYFGLAPLLFSQADQNFTGYHYYGYYFPVFMVILGLDIAIFRKLSTEAATLLYGIAVVYFGMSLVGFMLPLADLLHTTKRGLFKLLPLILLYYRNSPLLLKFSSWITAWETNQQTPKPKSVKAAPVAAKAAPAQNRSTPGKPEIKNKGNKK